jgi:hypothetical protein
MTLLAVVTLRASSGVPADNVINTHHIDVITSSAQARAAFTLAAEAFYQDVSAWFSNLLAVTGHTIEFYDLDDPQPRQPFGENGFDFTGALPSNSLPAEVACVVSSRAAYASGSPPARRRGRFYLGPFQGNAVEVTGKIKNTVVDDIATAAQTFYQAVNAGGDAEAVVYSQVDGVGRPIVQTWVDNEWDIQRRRGGIATYRNTLGV